jgi:hypothetical protein
MLLTTLLALLAAGSAFAQQEWPIPIPGSLLPARKDQHTFDTHPAKPENVRLIQTVKGRYQWTGDIEALLRDGVRLMDVP